MSHMTTISRRDQNGKLILLHSCNETNAGSVSEITILKQQAISNLIKFQNEAVLDILNMSPTYSQTAICEQACLRGVEQSCRDFGPVFKGLFLKFKIVLKNQPTTCHSDNLSLVTG